jgi:hypothetical protein
MTTAVKMKSESIEAYCKYLVRWKCRCFINIMVSVSVSASCYYLGKVDVNCEHRQLVKTRVFRMLPYLLFPLG